MIIAFAGEISIGHVGRYKTNIVVVYYILVAILKLGVYSTTP